MNFQVQPLKLLVTRKVVREGLDYSSYLTGKTREELDELDKFAGHFVVKTASTKASIKGKILSEEEWNSWRQDWPICLRSFWDGADEFSIFDRIHDGKREWEILDRDGSIKKFQLLSRGTRIYGRWEGNRFIKSPKTQNPKKGYWSYQEDFITDGKLTMLYRYGNNHGQLLFHEEDKMYINVQGNIVRSLCRSFPQNDAYVKIVMLASREDVVPDRDDMVGCPPFDLLHCYLRFCEGHYF